MSFFSTAAEFVGLFVYFRHTTIIIIVITAESLLGKINTFFPFGLLFFDVTYFYQFPIRKIFISPCFGAFSNVFRRGHSSQISMSSKKRKNLPLKNLISFWKNDGAIDTDIFPNPDSIGDYPEIYSRTSLTSDANCKSNDFHDR